VNEFRRGSLRSSLNGPAREVTVRAGSRIQEGAMMSGEYWHAVAALLALLAVMTLVAGAR